MEKQIGKFKINTSPPYPVWCSIEDGQGNEISFCHRELFDLNHCVDELMRDAKIKLREVNDEGGFT